MKSDTQNNDGQASGSSVGQQQFVRLVPQPHGKNQGHNLDCCEIWGEEGKYGFYEGNEMSGHKSVHGPIQAPEGFHPSLNNGVWIWEANDQVLTPSESPTDTESK